MPALQPKYAGQSIHAEENIVSELWSQVCLFNPSSVYILKHQKCLFKIPRIKICIQYMGTQ